MQSNRLKIAAGGLALLLLVAVGVSQTVKRTHMHGDGMFDGHMMGFFSDYLGLTDAQQAQAKAIMEKEKPNMKPLFQQMAQSHQDIRQVVESGNFDEAKVRSIATQQSQNMIEMEVQRARVESELYQILTPDQKTKLKDLMDKHEQRMMKHMQQAPADSNQQ